MHMYFRRTQAFTLDGVSVRNHGACHNDQPCHGDCATAPRSSKNSESVPFFSCEHISCDDTASGA